MKVHISTVFPSHPFSVFEDLQKPALLMKVASPIMAYRPVEPDILPPVWEEGKEYIVNLYLLGIIPIGRHRIGIEYFDKEKMTAKSDESGTITRLWSHLMVVKPYGNDRTLYTDEIEIKAGMLTLFVWLFASFFYRYRQKKWKSLLKT
jgi:hypothetical protein